MLAIGSDHSSILLSLSIEKVKRRKSFRFESFWLEGKDCGRIVKENWEELEGEGVDLVAKLQAIVVAPEKWSKKNFPNSHNQI